MEEKNNIPPIPAECYYERMTLTEAADFIGYGKTKFGELRKSDPDCPKGFSDGIAKGAPVFFRKADIMIYAALLIERAEKNLSKIA